MKAKIALLERAVADEEWDGTLNQAEQKLKQSMHRLLESASNEQHKAQQDFDKWDVLVKNHRDFITREEEKWKSWEETNVELNEAAKAEMKSKFVPQKYHFVEEIMQQKGVSRQVAQRVFRNKALQLIWMPKATIARLHHAALVNQYHVQGLDLRELRTVYSSLPKKFEFDEEGNKEAYKEMIRSKLFEMTERQKHGNMRANEEIHQVYKL